MLSLYLYRFTYKAEIYVSIIALFFFGAVSRFLGSR